MNACLVKSTQHEGAMSKIENQRSTPEITSEALKRVTEQGMSAAQATKRHNAPYCALHDTINLRPYKTVRIKTVQHDKGLRMFHCQILEHEGQGMMAQLLVK
jgi:FtsP/CotA-like multicopper oxidase with cupredoxin domain